MSKKSRGGMRPVLIFAAVACLSQAVAVSSEAGCGGGSSQSSRADGGKTNILTTRSGTVCEVFSPKGPLMCTRTYAIFNHQEAIKKCLAIKC